MEPTLQPKQNSIIFGVILGVVLLMLVGAGAYYFSTVARDQNRASNTNTSQNTNAADTTNVNGGSETVNGDEANDTGGGAEGTTVVVDDSDERIVDEGVTWLARPQKLDPLPLFQENTGYSYTYYKVADLVDGGELMYVAGESMGTSVLRFKKDADGTYSLLVKYSDFWFVEVPGDLLQPGVLTDTETMYGSLQYPSFFDVKGLRLNQDWGGWGYNALFDVAGEGSTSTIARPSSGTIDKFADTAFGPLYVSVTPLQTETKGLAFYTKKYVLVLSDTSTVTYTVDTSLLADDGTIRGTLTTAGESYKERQFSRGFIADGCGGPTGNQFPAEVDEAQLTAIGLSVNNEPLYAPKDSFEPLLRAGYDAYKLGRDYPGSPTPAMSYEDFVAAEPLFLWKDAVGDYHIYRDTEFGPMAECGKPVIYLYPTRTTPVSVRVEADVTVSEPAYGNGWNVVAQPDGTLTTAVGEVVASLYWEGKGRGEYPSVTVGNVVATKDVEQHLRKDLTTMGLNTVETQDFLDFWLPLMPPTPYVRLTWFDTAQMNRLAPLSINPRPQTVLRVFLDFKGQDTAETSLAPQTVRRTERRGFTVVEWGGLLVGGHQSLISE